MEDLDELMNKIEPTENIQYEVEEEPETLDDLENTGFKPLSKKELAQQAKTAKEQAKQAKTFMIAQAKQAKFEAKLQKDNIKKAGGDNEDELFSGNGTEILGRDKIILLKKIKQYKSLFPAELKTFKIKKNPSVKDLEDALQEMAVLVETNGMDEFLMDGVIQCIKLVEGASAMTSNYDITGCAALLKSNKQFHNLAKQLFIKYNCFSSVPPEYQMIMLVSTTAYMCANKNRQKSSINAYLDEKI